MKKLVSCVLLIALWSCGGVHLFAVGRKGRISWHTLHATTSPAANQNAQGESHTGLPNGCVLLLGGIKQGVAIGSGWINCPKSPSATPTTGHLKVSRAWHTATLLPNGSVLVLGGIGTDGSIVSSAEIIDPTVGTVIQTPLTGLTARARHTATLLTDGRVLVIGGIGANGEPLDQIEAWNFRTGKTSTLPIQLGTPRSGHSAILLPDGSVLVWGGVDKNGSPVSYGEVIDPVSMSVRTEATSAAAEESNRRTTLMQSLPTDGATSVPLNALISFRFSRPLSVTSATSSTVVMTTDGVPVPAKIVPAEAGILVFVSPQVPFLPGTTYTVSLNGLIDGAGQEVPAIQVTFTTIGLPAQSSVAGSSTESQSSTNTASTTPPLKAPPGVTAVSGRVLVTSETPLVHVSIEIDSHRTFTDTAGRFLLEGLAPGHHAMIVDGAPANSKNAAWGLYRIGVDVQRGQTTILKYTIWMTPLDTQHVVRISSPTRTNLVITNPQIPGLELRIPANTVITDARGRAVTQIGITPIPLGKPPFPLPPGTRFPVYFTIQPGGLTFTTAGASTTKTGGTQATGAQIHYQNATSAKAGTRFDFLSYDPFNKGWHVYGRGRVSADGRKITPDLGTQVITFDGVTLSMWNGPPPIGPNDCSTSDGYSVDLQTGLFVLSQTDLAMPGSTPLSVTRRYRQLDGASRPFGTGSSTPYDMFLSGDDDNFPEGWTYQDLTLEDGGRVHFTRVTPCDADGYCSCVAPIVVSYTTTEKCYYGATLQHACPVPLGRPSNNLSAPKVSSPQKLTTRPGLSDPNGVTSSPWILTLADGTVYGFQNSYDGVRVTDYRSATPTGVLDRNSNWTDFTRDDSGNLIQVSGSNGRSIQFTYDDSGLVTTASDSSGRSIGYSYDAQGRLASFTDAAGNVTHYTYDDNDDMVSIIKPDQNLLVTNSYDPNGRVSQQTFPNGGTYRFSYALDGNGNVAQTTVTDPSGSVRQVQFNSDGHLTSDTVGLGTPQQETTTYELQPVSGVILSSTDALGRKTAYTYDALGETTSVTRLAGTSQAVTTYLSYPPLVTLNGVLSSPSFGSPSSVTDPLGNTTQFAYDASGNVLNVTDPLGNVTSITYNGDGQIAADTDALGNVTRFSYDSGDLVGVTDPLGRTTTRFPDAAGNVISTTDAAGHTTRYTYTPLDQVLTVTDPLGAQTSFGYYPNGTLHTVTDANQHTTSYAYDNMDRLQSRQDPLGNTETYQYDANSRLKWYTDRRGVITGYGYDSLGRRVFAGFGYNGSSYDSTVNYSFDPGNRLTDTLDSLTGTIHHSFDGLDGLVSETTPQGSISYTYDGDERRQTMTVAGQPTVQYTFDSTSRLRQIRQNGATVALDYDAAGRRTSLTLPNGVLTQYGYDQASELTSIQYLSGAAALGDLQYSYDPAGRRTGVSGSFARTNLPNAISGATYNQNNQLTQWGSISPTYDLNGNLQNDGVSSYSWNSRNQLASMNGGTDVFTYDSFGRRIAKSISSTAKVYLYDGANSVQELQGGNVTANLMTGGIDELFLRTDSSGAWNFLADALGSTAALTDTTGQIQTQYTYEPFGNTTATGTTSGNVNDYTGRELDETGLYFYRARYYNPQIGRFISEDPIRLAGGINFYAYVGNDPSNRIDPLGLAQCVYSISAHTMVCQPNADPGQPSTYGPNGAGAVRLGPNDVWSGDPKKGCKNEPKCEYDRDAGPIPPGDYKMNYYPVDEHDRFRLEPWPNDRFSRAWRDIFHPRYHGLGAQLHRGSFSDGCINASQDDPSTMQQYDQLLQLLLSEDGNNWLRVTE